MTLGATLIHEKYLVPFANKYKDEIKGISDAIKAMIEEAG